MPRKLTIKAVRGWMLYSVREKEYADRVFRTKASASKYLRDTLTEAMQIQGIPKKRLSELFEKFSKQYRFVNVRITPLP